jgi:hypothetical protein
MLIEAGVNFTSFSKSTRFSVSTLSSDPTSSKATTRVAGMRPLRSANRASLRPRLKKVSGGSTRISVFRTSNLFHQPAPFPLEPRLDPFEAFEVHGNGLTFEMPVMNSMG